LSHRPGEGSSNPPLSVVLGTTQRWPELEPLIETVVPQAREIGAEVIVVDNNGAGLPEKLASQTPEIVWITDPGASIFRMRSVGMSVARGDVVALTEDHCLPSPGWCKAHLDGHARHPDVAAVGGTVANGATGELSAWGSFLINHSDWMPPTESRMCRMVDRANISYKRSVVPRTPTSPDVAEPLIDDHLLSSNAKFFLSADALVTHDQSFGLRGTLSIHFHSGRSLAGSRVRRGLGLGTRLTRAITSALLGPAMFVQTVRRTARRPKSARILASLPMAFAVASAISAGLVVGYLFGPGKSATRIR
jgi:glycosyl transferase family 2